MLGIWSGDPYVNKRGNVLKCTKSVPILGKSSQHISHVPEEVPCLQFQAMRSIMEHDSSVMYIVPKESNVMYSLVFDSPQVCPSMPRGAARIVARRGGAQELLLWDCTVGCAGYGGGGGHAERSHGGQLSRDKKYQSLSNSFHSSDTSIRGGQQVSVGATVPHSRCSPSPRL